jgi:bacillithiol biosynthesis cysteine-adding enzyme BshC
MRIAKSLSNRNIEASQDPFLGISYRDPQSLEKAKFQVDKYNYPRLELASILEKYNRQLGNDNLAIENCKKLRQAGSYCVVTGQQLGMMGGPAYTILKGITCLLVARQAGAIPIFWLATEDHDIPEIDHTFLLDESGNFKKFQLSISRNGIAVEDISLTSRNIEEIYNFWSYLGLENILYNTGDSYSQYMIKVLMHLFAGTGMLFLEPKLLRKLAEPFFAKELEQCEAIQNLLKETTHELEKVDGNPILQVGQPTNLFLKNKELKRLKIRFDGSMFTHGADTYSLSEMLQKAKKTPELFSCNVAARPVLQNTLLPVIAYVGGPNELAYHRQLGRYHSFHGIDMPCIIPRIEATMISQEAATTLEAAKMQPWEEIPLHKENIPGKQLHMIRNLFYPHNQPQERLLNWWNFQAKSNENLVSECLKQLSWDFSGRYYIYL